MRDCVGEAAIAYPNSILILSLDDVGRSMYVTLDSRCSKTPPLNIPGILRNAAMYTKAQGSDMEAKRLVESKISAHLQVSSSPVPLTLFTTLNHLTSTQMCSPPAYPFLVSVMVYRKLPGPSAGMSRLTLTVNTDTPKFRFRRLARHMQTGCTREFRWRRMEACRRVLSDLYGINTDG